MLCTCSHLRKVLLEEKGVLNRLNNLQKYDYLFYGWFIDCNKTKKIKEKTLRQIANASLSTNSIDDSSSSEFEPSSSTVMKFNKQ